MDLWYHKLLRPDTALRAALWLALLTVAASTTADPDLWGHVRFGIDILHDRVLNQVDTYSFTADREWVNHEWLAEVVSAAAYNAAGAAGLVLVKVAVVFAVLLLLNGALASEGVEPRRRDLLAGIAVIATIQQAHHVRPQLFSLLGFAVLLTAMLRARHDRRFLLLVPAVFAVWANLHGGWIVGGAILVLWTAGVAVSSRGNLRGVWPLLAAGVAALVATLLNPRGIGLLRFLRETVGFGRADIVDWQPIYVLGPPIWIPWVIVAAVAAAGVARTLQRGELPWERLLPIAVLAAGSFQVNRLVSFFALATLFLLGPALGGGRAERPALHRRRSIVLAALTMALIVAGGSLRVLAAKAGCVAIDSRTAPEPGAVDFFKRHHLQGKLLVWFDWGQYALWHLAPGLRVSVDGRRETVYSAAVQDRHLRFYFDAPGGASLPSDLDADYVWIPKGLPAVARLRSAGWIEVYSGTQSVIFSRVTIAGGAPLPVAGIGGPRCFPGR